MTFASNDYGLFVFGRTILAKNPAVCLTFFYNCDSPENSNHENAVLWDAQINEISAERLGVMFDHNNESIAAWLADKEDLISFPTQALHHLANEGLADSVEFRRLARKFIRKAKEHNCQLLFFPELIFAEPKTQKILQHLAGSQLKIVTCQLRDTKYKIPEAETQHITIYHSLADITFLKSRAETILGKKLKNSDFQKK